VYLGRWIQTALENSKIYAELEGDLSFDNCSTLDAFTQAINTSPLLSANDESIRRKLGEVKGHLVMWPQQFLHKDNLVSLAHSTVLPPELFA
jgi:hypothetical protein